jgi:hypothetical protein
LDEVINHALTEAFQKPLMASLIQKITDLSTDAHNSLKRTRLIRRKCKEIKGIFLLLKHIWAHTAKKDGNVTTRN